MTQQTGPILIFSLLNVRKKTAAAVAGIGIAALCLWGLSLWQDISLQEMLNILLSTVLMLGSIILAAGLLIVVIKLLAAAVQKISHFDDDEDRLN
ncbi:MAG TPA: hypothetical protein QGF41_05360 [Gammaproteobacteria bacterium]|nr:hypothetical protein [Gammaproteobacteria bacterium]